MIIKRKEGYYVTGWNSKVHLGGPYKKKEDAERRLLQLGLPNKIRK
jgi:hypothetical protein